MVQPFSSSHTAKPKFKRYWSLTLLSMSLLSAGFWGASVSEAKTHGMSIAAAQITAYAQQDPQQLLAQTSAQALSTTAGDLYIEFNPVAAHVKIEASLADLANIREHIIKHIVGSSKPTASDFEKAMAGIIDPTKTYVDEQGRKHYEPLLANEIKMDKAYKRYQHLLVIAKQYYFTREPELIELIAKGLRELNKNHWYTGGPEKGNWWNYEIGTPKQVLQTLLVTYEHWSPAELKEFVDPSVYYQPDPYWSGVASGASFSSSPNKRLSTGGNRLDLAIISFYRGAIRNDPQEMQYAITSVNDTALLVTYNDGFYDDGTFIQHTNLPYNGTYGQVLLENYAIFKKTTIGTKFVFGDAAVENLLSRLGEWYSYMLIGNRMSDAWSGRAVYKYNIDYKQAEDSLFTYYSRYDSSSDLDRGKAIIKTLGQLGVKIYSPTDNRYFPYADRAVMRNKDEGVVVLAMHSSRIANMETMNGDNPYGAYTSDGMTYIYGKNESANVGYQIDYDYNFVPGTTQEKRTLGMRYGEKRKFNDLSPRDFVGGITSPDNRVFVGFDWGNTRFMMEQQRSYFLTDKGLVVFAHTTNRGGNDIYTTIDNRRLDNYILENRHVIPAVDAYIAQGMDPAAAKAKYIAEIAQKPAQAQIFVEGKPITTDTYFEKAPKEVIFVDSAGTKIGYQLYNLPNLEITFKDGFVRLVSHNAYDFSYGIYPQSVNDPDFKVEAKVFNEKHQVFFDPNNNKTYINFFVNQKNTYAGFTSYGAVQAIQATNEQGDLVLELNDPTHHAQSLQRFVLDQGYTLVSSTTKTPVEIKTTAKGTELWVDLRTHGKPVTLVLRPVKNTAAAK
ncbi:polysaccharide lyase family 8 super-sandwich domain-containing protein [Psittacicella hinzii]|uniref:Uncharacterized protein n=1 Tax=Psittacicella hinzii TaxID=2028575 RepID=A0A3A1YVD4_9GAMM|nr:polysaccharide lyase family 8 super-sandwich domain-containing protein [Psittacicella hinzii]RIY40800.1 hypothetical protein CKF58_00130 [Psittacicella hinzii]